MTHIFHVIEKSSECVLSHNKPSLSESPPIIASSSSLGVYSVFAWRPDMLVLTLQPLASLTSATSFGFNQSQSQAFDPSL
jgi:hypothetical protein